MGRGHCGLTGLVEAEETAEAMAEAGQAAGLVEPRRGARAFGRSA